MDAEIAAVKAAAENLGRITQASRKSVEDAIADLTTKKDAAHKVIDSTYNDLIKQALADVVPINTK